MRTLLYAFVLLIASQGAAHAAKKKVLVVSSYHREYGWSQETNKGLLAGLLKIGWLDSQAQADAYTKTDNVESSKIILKKVWMDAKHKTKPEEKAESAKAILETATQFGPDVVFLGDDDAAEYIGRKYLDTKTPIIFWGINNTPVKYGLVDSMEKPGHNVTGIYQSGYYKESLDLAKILKPKAQTVALVTDTSNTGRAYLKSLGTMNTLGQLPLKLVDSTAVATFEEFKSKVLDLQTKADVIFFGQYTTLKNDKGEAVPDTEVTKWLMANNKLAETTAMDTFVKQGLLCAAVDSGYKQGYEAAMVARDVIDKGADISAYPPRAPSRGPFAVNAERAKQLGLKATKEMGVEELVETAKK